MTSLTNGLYDGQSLPLDLRVHRNRLDDDLFVSKVSSGCGFQAGCADQFRRMPTSIYGDGPILKQTSILDFVKNEKTADYDYSDERFSFHYTAKEEFYVPPRRQAKETNGKHDSFYKFIKQEKGRIDYSRKAVHLPYPAESEFYPGDAANLQITVKQEPEPETEESDFQPNGENPPFANDFLSKVEENSSDEDNLIIDVNIEEKTPRKKRLDRSDSNSSSSSNSSYLSDTGDDVKAFLRNYSSPYKVHKCSKCKVGFSDLLALFQHLEAHVSQNPGERFMKCPLCMRKFQKLLGINAHIRKMHLGPMEFVCQFCQMSFKFNLHLQKHETTCKKKKKVECADGNNYGA